MSDAALAALDGLARELEALLGALDAPGGDPRRAWSRCAEAFARVRAAAAAGTPLSPRARARLQDAQRLHAIAGMQARRAAERVRDELNQVRGARRKLRVTLAEGAPARGCDVQG